MSYECVGEGRGRKQHQLSFLYQTYMLSHLFCAGVCGVIPESGRGKASECMVGEHRLNTYPNLLFIISLGLT